MAIRKSSSSGIPFGNTAGRPASPGTGQLYSNGQLGRLELYTETGWQNIVQESPGIASISGTYNESAGSGTFTISGTNFVTGGIAYAIGTNGTEYQATTSTTNSIVSMTAVFTALSASYEPYDVKVLNPSNLFGLLPDAFYINDSPVWSTSSGSLGTYPSSVSIQLAATDDESNTITYSVTSGSLPTGLSLSSSGLISGTVTATPATYTFTVSASDGINTAVTRSFNIIVPVPTITGGSLTSDATYYYRTFTSSGNFITNTALSCDYLIVAGGGSGGVWSEGSGYLDGLKGTNSSFNSETAIGGGGGKSWNNGANADGGSGGGGSGNRTAGGAATTGQGNPGGVGHVTLGSGGGGGAGAVGGIGNGSKHGDGGAGLNWKSLGTFYSGGGGGGGSGGTPGNRGIGGSGGGGNGAVAGSAYPLPSSGSSNTGGGGGGADGWYGQYHGGGGAGGLIQNTNTLSATTLTVTIGGGASAVGISGPATDANKNVLSGAGGSGIVIIRYTKASVGG